MQIVVLATGTNVVDLTAARERKVVVTNVPDYSTDSVAQLTLALLLELALRTGDHAASVRRGDWNRCPDFNFTLQPLQELTGRTPGLVGYGRIGRAVARLGCACGMHVIAHTRRPTDDPHVRFVDLDPLFPSPTRSACIVRSPRPRRDWSTTRAWP